MLQVGIIGIGRIGKVHLQSIATQVPEAHIKMVADPFMNDEIEQMVLGMGVDKVTKDYHDILDDNEIEAVLICSSTDTHASISIEAIKAGKHVFCEKPIDHDVTKIREVLDTLKENPVKYMVGFNRRFDHNFKAVRDAVVNGKVGDTHLIKITSRDPEPPNIDYVKVSGGMFLDMTIHDFDMVRYLAGCDVVEVYAQAAVLVDEEIGKAGDVDTAAIVMTMENGAIAIIDNSRKATYGYDQRAEVFGSQGMASCENDTASKIVISNSSGITSEVPLHFFLERYMNAYASEVKSFIDAIANNTDTPSTAEDGLKAVLIGLAAQKSVAEHRPVKISEIS